MKHTGIAIALILALLLSGCASAEKTEKQSVVGFYFDTVITLSDYAPDDRVLKEALDKCAVYEKLLSKTVPGSDVWNLNHAGGKPVAVSDDTLEILKVAKKVYEMSGGAFDITIAPATELWDFTGANNVLPDENALAEAAAKADFSKIQIDGNKVTLPEPMMIDLGGIAKGYIADGLAAFFREEGIEHAVLSLGGNVITVGAKPDGAKWRVGIQDPDEPTGDYLLISSVSDLSVVTSGVYERGFDLNGVRYHHILDTKTGWPIQNGLKSVTIFSESSALGDALSTAVFALGLEAGTKLVEAFDGVEAIFVTDDRSIQMTSGAEKYT